MLSVISSTQIAILNKEQEGDKILVISILNQRKVSIVRWKLREVMARRRITNKALAIELDVHPTSISRLRTQDVLPEIGGEVLGRLIDGINKLTVEGYGDCTLEELTELVSE